MQSFGALFRADATFVNRFGHSVRDVEQIVELHAPTHATLYSDSKLGNEAIDVIAIGDDAAVLHFWSRLAIGAAHPAGPHAVDTVILAVLTRRTGQWRIQARDNVTLMNPWTAEAVLRGHRGLGVHCGLELMENLSSTMLDSQLLVGLGALRITLGCLASRNAPTGMSVSHSTFFGRHSVGSQCALQFAQGLGE